ncbi:MAG: DNA mismatch repair endonuclease MutL [Methanoregulaceae archaeon]|nr:DNA mismatch repair endonuclease MutL [Methanoregulaceae archaeon]
MTSRQVIHVLDPGVISLISAGEVVEGPASVVKELVENSIDAMASRITVTLQSSGGTVRSIRVVDDGAGMSPADAALAFTRYATSKIAGIGDLSVCTTMGFRGEALASIGAVARVSLTTKERGTGPVAGTRIVFEGGETLLSEETGAPDGTTVLVEDLFFNTPARRKFQKSLQTEIARITGVMERAAISNPAVAFRLVHNGRERLATRARGNLSDTLSDLYGKDLVSGLVPFSGHHPSGEFTGFIAKPAIQRPNPYQVFISINHRPVISRSLTAGLRDGYGTLLPKDRYPVAFIDCSIAGPDVDVNVHPAKKIVRIGREEEICKALADAVRQALRGENLVPEPDAAKSAVMGSYSASPAVAPAVHEAAPPFSMDTDRRLRRSATLIRDTGPGEPVLPAYRVIGQAMGLYIVAESEYGDLVLIDQHAAHERILYEQLLRSPQGERQELISPLVLEFSPQEHAILAGLIPGLNREGFGIEQFGKESLIIQAVPVVLGRSIGPAAIREVIGEFLRSAPSQAPGERERIVRVVACRGAIKAGSACSVEQCERLIAQLRTAENPYTCPHGRPTIVSFQGKNLDRLFGRG